MSNSSDNDLVFLIKKGYKPAYQTLYKKYSGLFHKVCFSFMRENKIPQLYLDDFMSIANESFQLAVEKFEIGNGSFRNFWWTITLTKFKNYYARNNSIQLNTDDVSLRDKINQKLRDEELESKEQYNPLSNEIVILINNNIDLFTEDERIYLQFVFMSYSNQNICTILGWKKNKLFRIRHIAIEKLNKIIKSN